MRIRNHRRKKVEFIWGTVFVLGITTILIVWNFLKTNPEQGFGFWGAIAFFILVPYIILIPYYLLTAKEIVIEDGGVAQYKKGKLIKLLKYDEVQTIYIDKANITINGTRREDYPYHHINTFFRILFKLLFSRKFRKKFYEDKIIFKNYKKGFYEIELPFVIKIAKKCECKIILLDDYKNDKNAEIIDNALNKAIDN
jgi:hypothetical protein